MAHAIKREDIVAAAFFGRGAALEHLPIADKSRVLQRGSGAWLGLRSRPCHQALLAEAGYAHGFSCTMLSTAQYGMHQSTAEVSQAYLAAIGINVTLDLPDWATRVQKGNAGQYDLAVMGTTADNNDPDGLTNIIDGTLPASFVRSIGVAVERRSTMLLAEGRVTFDAAKRKDDLSRDGRRRDRERADRRSRLAQPGLCDEDRGHGLHQHAGAADLLFRQTFEDTAVG